MAGRIRDEDVVYVREHTPIDDVVGDFVQLKNAGGGQKKGLCPFHDEKSPSFHVTPSKGFFHCFGCGVGGDAINFLMKLEHLTFTETVERLAERIGYQLHYDSTGPSAGSGEHHRRLWKDSHHRFEIWFKPRTFYCRTSSCFKARTSRIRKVNWTT